MNSYSFKMLGVLAGCALFGGLAAQAQDKTTLDLLVKKGTISQAEADDAMKNAAVVVNPKDKATRKLQLEGMVQVQYDWLNTMDKAPNAANPPSVSQAYIRRAYLGAIADLGNGWGGEVLMDFAAGTGASGQVANRRNNFEKLIITKKVDVYGTGTAGYTKVQFGKEENTSSSVIKTVERSIATRYFAEGTSAAGSQTAGNLGFGSYHVGGFWDGVVPGVDGLFYGGALTTGVQDSVAFGGTGAAGAASYNQFAGWVNLGYNGKYDTLTYTVGMNLGYSGDGNDSPATGAVGAPIAANTGPASGNALWGFNPYITLNYGDFSLMLEYLQGYVTNGRSGSNAAGSGPGANVNGTTVSDAAPYGFNVIPSYKINDQWEVVARFSALSTNGRGMAISGVQPNAQNTLGAGGQLYNNAYSFYLGFNYYIIGNSLKITAGYEFTQFSDRSINGGTSVANGGSVGQQFSGSKANVNGFRTRLQLLF